MTGAMEQGRKISHYFVDEAGDGNLFSAKGKVIIGQEGCSRFFILGLLDIQDPDALGRELEELRSRLLSDPYFKGVPSMQPEARKTALAFHAKDDLPEVRREVMAVLRTHPLEFKFFAVVRNKYALLEYVIQRNRHEAAYHYNPNELYDYLVRCLFPDKLHKRDEYNITFSHRGKSDRTQALQSAIEQARATFYRRLGIITAPPVNIAAQSSAESAGLQVVDYFLWALQRLYEQREERYVELLWESFRLVRDLDDTREARYGVYYTQKKPLRKAALPDLPEI